MLHLDRECVVDPGLETESAHSMLKAPVPTAHRTQQLHEPMQIRYIAVCDILLNYMCPLRLNLIHVVLFAVCLLMFSPVVFSQSEAITIQSVQESGMPEERREKRSIRTPMMSPSISERHMEEYLAPLEEQVTSLDGNVRSLNERVGSLHDQIESLSERIESLDEQIESLNDTVRTLSHLTSAVDTLRTRVSGIGSRLNRVDDFVAVKSCHFELYRRSHDKEREYDFNTGRDDDMAILSGLNTSCDQGDMEVYLRRRGGTMSGSENWHIFVENWKSCNWIGVQVVFLDGTKVGGLRNSYRSQWLKSQTLGNRSGSCR